MSASPSPIKGRVLADSIRVVYIQSISLAHHFIMASHPPGECCGRGFKHEGVATGEIKKIGQCAHRFPQ
jgi:hypothetical protein